MAGAKVRAKRRNAFAALDVLTCTYFLISLFYQNCRKKSVKKRESVTGRRTLENLKHLYILFTLKNLTHHHAEQVKGVPKCLVPTTFSMELRKQIN